MAQANLKDLRSGNVYKLGDIEKITTEFNKTMVAEYSYGYEHEQLLDDEIIRRFLRIGKSYVDGKLKEFDDKILSLENANESRRLRNTIEKDKVRKVEREESILEDTNRIASLKKQKKELEEYFSKKE